MSVFWDDLREDLKDPTFRDEYVTELERIDLFDGLVNWLLDNGYAEDKAGYGHVSAEELADALLECYEMRVRD